MSNIGVHKSCVPYDMLGEACRIAACMLSRFTIIHMLSVALALVLVLGTGTGIGTGFDDDHFGTSLNPVWHRNPLNSLN